MKKTLAQIQRAHPELRAALAAAAERCTPARRNRAGSPLYSVPGLLVAARTMAGQGHAQHATRPHLSAEFRRSS